MKEKAVKKIGVLTGGGDCPGLNAVIRAVTKTAILQHGWKVWGSEDSFDGFIKPDKMVQLSLESVRGILPRGGTILGTTNRGNPFKYPVRRKDGKYAYKDYSSRVISRIGKLGLNGLVVIGGDGTLSIAQQLYEKGIPVVGVPKTIDNDLLVTEVSFGFDTALTTATEAIDKIHTTAESHDRVMIVEVMGRNAGWIALESGIAGGADVILIPEIPFRMESVCAKIESRAQRGHTFSVVVVAEGAVPVGGEQVYRESAPLDAFGKLGGISFKVGQEIERRMSVEARVLVLGHLQRGGSPTPFDRLLGTRFGVAAVDLIARGDFGRMVCLSCGLIESVPIKDAVAREKLVDPLGDRVRTARAIGISLGD